MAASYCNNVLPSGSEREGISQAFSSVRVAQENSVPSKSWLCNLSNVKRNMITGARLAGAFRSRTANLMDVSKTTVSRVMTTYTNLSKVSSTKHNSGWKLTDHDWWMLKRIVTQNCKSTLSNTYLQNLISMKIILRELYAVNIHGRVAILKWLIFAWNVMKRQQWWWNHLTWTQMQWEQVIWSDESWFTLFQSIRCVEHWQKHVRLIAWFQPWNMQGVLWWCRAQYLLVDGGLSLSWRDDYRWPLSKHFCRSSSLCASYSLFLWDPPVFQDDNTPVHTSHCVQTWLHEHDDEV